METNIGCHHGGADQLTGRWGARAANANMKSLLGMSEAKPVAIHRLVFAAGLDRVEALLDACVGVVFSDVTQTPLGKLLMELLRKDLRKKRKLILFS